MKKHLTMLRRPLALLLAVLMVLSNINGAIVTASAPVLNRPWLQRMF